jgi:hypothetical protein
MAVTRPPKEGSVTTYQQKVALGFPDILASEMDADLDTIYAAWNGNVGTANLVDGSVTTAKLADGSVALGKIAVGAVRGTPSSGGTAREIVKASIWGGDDLIDASVTSAKLAALAVTTAKVAVGASVATQSQADQTMPVGTLAGATEAVITSVAGLTFRGGLVLILADLTIRTFFPDDSNCVLRLYVDGTLNSARNLRGGVQSTTGGLGAAVMCLAQPTAGSHTVSFRWIRTSGTGNFELVNAHLNVVELA